MKGSKMTIPESRWNQLLSDPTQSIKSYEKGSLRSVLEEKYSSKLVSSPESSSLVSYMNGKKLPISRLFRYKEAFSQNLVSHYISRLKLTSRDYILDPFCGMGTTNFTAMINDIPSVGVEKLPLAYFIATTLPKLISIKEGELLKSYENLKGKIQNSSLVEITSDVPIMNKAFDSKTLLLLRKWKFQIDSLEEPHRSIFLLFFFSILEECSFTSKDGQFLRLLPNKAVKNPTVVIKEKVIQAEEDIHHIRSTINKSKISVPLFIEGDARNLSDYFANKRKPNVIITSPPYLNRYDYTRTYCLELCFHFVKNFEELKKIRFGILRSHIESKVSDIDKKIHPVVGEVVKKLEGKDLNNPRIPLMISAYFADMKLVLKELNKTLADKAKIVLVVDNVRFEGEMIPVDLILSEMAEEEGFKIREIIVARYKGNSSQQMKKYGLDPVRESIVLWER